MNIGYNGIDELFGFLKFRYWRVFIIFVLFLYRIVVRGGKRGLFLCFRIRWLNCFVVGVYIIVYVYLKVKIVIVVVDLEVNDKYYVIFGIGELYLLIKLLIFFIVFIYF